MDINPQQIRTAEFRTVRKGLDPDEVRGFLASVADEFQRAQNEATAMEARARAAVARVQELESSGAVEAAPTSVAPTGEPSTEQADAISRTLLLAQRTADTTIAEAEREANRVRGDAETESAKTLDSTREMAAKLIEEARDEARRESDEARSAAAGEVDALLARRDFLESDVSHLERFLAEQRSRLREAAGELVALVDRVPAGLGEVRAPLLSAADESPDQLDRPDANGAATSVSAGAADPTQALDPPVEQAVVPPPDGDDAESTIPEHTPVFGLADTARARASADDAAGEEPGGDESAADDEFRFSFDDEQR